MKMLEMPAEFLAAEELLAECGEELTPEQAEAMEALTKDLENGAVMAFDRWCNWIRNDESDAAAEQGRIDQINMWLKAARDRRTAAENRADRKKEIIKRIGMAIGMLTLAQEVPGKKAKVPGRKIETAPTGYKIHIQNVGGKQALLVDEHAEIPEEFLTYLPPVINYDAIRAALDEGKTLSFAKFQPKGIALVIK